LATSPNLWKVALSEASPLLASAVELALARQRTTVHKPETDKFADALSKVKKSYPPALAGDLDCLLFDMELLKEEIVAFRGGAPASTRKEQRLRLFHVQIAVEQDLTAVLRDVAEGLRKMLGAHS
jgi:hypothetical protein